MIIPLLALLIASRSAAITAHFCAIGSSIITADEVFLSIPGMLQPVIARVERNQIKRIFVEIRIKSH